MYRKNLLKITLVTAIIGTCITRCSFNFALKNINNAEYPTHSSNFNGYVKDVSNIIDTTDFTDENDIENMVEEIDKWADNVVENNEEIDKFVEAKLIRVVDGDTIVVEINEKEYKVRLIGIDTPESVASQEYLDKTGKENTQIGIDASNYTKKILENVTTIYLEKDVSDTDKYNRLLRYVWIEKPNDINIDTISTQMLNGILLKNGIAQIATYQPDIKYVEIFKELNQNIYDDIERD